MQRPKKIAYVDGRRLTLAFLAGAKHLIEKQTYLDDINVFPVPDKDTGTNMSSTMKAIVEDLQETPLHHSLEKVISRVADSALMGARGNSGAILAQFFCGLSEGLQGLSRATPQHLSQALLLADQRSREVLSRPMEGTILSVIGAFARILHQECQKGTSADLHDLYLQSLEEAQMALEKTKTQLESLEAAHVVDAGAQGFVFFLEGIWHYLQKGTDLLELGKEPKDLEGQGDQSGQGDHDHHLNGENILYRYCTECLIVADHRGSLTPLLFKERLASLGDSLIVAGGKQKIRIHMHTDHPGKVFQMGRDWGVVSQEKVDDMKQQFRDAHHRPPAPHSPALVVDSACDLPDEYKEKYNIHTVPVRVSFGEESFIDKVTLDAEGFYHKLETSPHHPKTSQPTPADFKRCYELVMKNYPGAISIHVPKALSGTFQAAKNMAHQISPDISVVDGNSASCGLGLLSLEAAKGIEAKKTKEEILRDLEKAKTQLKIILILDTLEYLVRGGRINKVKGAVGNFLKLKPILTMTSEGTLEVLAKTFGGQAAQRKMISLLREMVGNKRNRRFAIAHGKAPELAEFYANVIRREFSPDFLYITTLSPALGAHGGPGAVAISFLGDERGDEK